jgi:hypothetical protein
MLGYGWLTEVERFHKLRNIRVPGSKASEHSSPRGICERCKDRTQMISLGTYHHIGISPSGDILIYCQLAIYVSREIMNTPRDREESSRARDGRYASI